MKPIARGGYHDYSVLTESFTMRRRKASRRRARRRWRTTRPAKMELWFH